MKCREVSALLVDFLYQELPENDRHAFLAHVESCASCSLEAKALSSTLGQARAALRGPLASAPPERVRARVLEAAAAAVTERATLARPARAPKADGFFARLWKTPWLLPAVSAASVATVVLLVKVIGGQQVIPETKPAMTETPAQHAAGPAGVHQVQARSETEPQPLVGRAPLDKPVAEPDRKSHAELKRAASAGRPHGAMRARDNPPPVGQKLAISSDGLSEIDDELHARTPRSQPAVGEAGGAAAMPSRKNQERGAAKGGSDTLAEGSPSTNRWAEPPPPQAPTAVAFAAAPVAAALPPVRKAKAFADLAEMQKSAEGERVSRSAEPGGVQASVRKHASEPVAQTSALAEKKAAKDDKEGLSFEERVRRAERLFAERKWSEAAVAFRALIAQAPSNPAVKTWRERVIAADQAQDQARAAKASKAHTGEVLDGR